jgi:dCMP deaminase
MPRTWKYREGDVVVINDTCDEKDLVGKIGTVNEPIQQVTYDYRIIIDGVVTKVMESEIDRLYFKPKQKVKYKNNDEIVEVTKLDYPNKQVGIMFSDGAFAVVGLLDIEKTENLDQRKSWDEYFMDIAETVSTRATCNRLHVGCVIVKDKRIISTGYNGSVSGKEQCDEVDHLYNDQNRCIRTIHAEQNSLLFANRDELKGATAYITHYPCENCAKLLVQSGIKRVVYKHTYENKFSKYFLDMIETIQLEECDE